MSGIFILSENRALNNTHADKSIVNRIFWIVGLAVAMIAASSFALSFTALYELASSNGIPLHLGWIWPLIVDVSMVIYTAAILVAQVQRRGAKLPIALSVFYGLVTITGNLLHAPATLLGWFVAALPPISLILGSEVLRTMGHHIILQQASEANLKELDAHIQGREQGLDRLNEQIEQANARLQSIREATIAAAQAQKQANDGFILGDREALEKANQTRLAQIEVRREQVLVLLEEKLSTAQIAARLKVSAATIRRDRAAINGRLTE